MRSAGGDDHIYVGSGQNLIEPGEGRVVFHVAYGGVTHISGWHDDYQLDLSAWPLMPEIRVTKKNRADIRLGVSFIRIDGPVSDTQLRAQISQVKS